MSNDCQLPGNPERLHAANWETSRETHNERPLITFVLLAYNQESYIEEAVRGALSQTYSPLEIILSDDCSSDRTYEIMKELVAQYDGPHEIRMNRNEQNLGLVPHVNRIFEMASGEIVTVAAGDDISLPDRVENTWQAFDQNPGVLSVTMEQIAIDAHGNALPHQSRPFMEGKYSLEDFIQERRIPILGATRAYHKKLFDVFGPLSSRCRGEDVVIPFRALLIGLSWHLAIPGIFYRHHDKSISRTLDFASPKAAYQQRKKDLELATTKGYLPDGRTQGVLAVMASGLLLSLVVSRLQRSNRKTLYFLSSILPSRRFSMRQKWTCLAIYLCQVMRPGIVSRLRAILAIAKRWPGSLPTSRVGSQRGCG